MSKNHASGLIQTVMSKKQWVKNRHKVARNIAFAALYPYMRIKYGVKPERFKEQEKRPYLILYNHQTPFDQFFVGASFHGAIYYVATEDIFSMGKLSSLIRWLAAPVPIAKGTNDASAIIKCIRIAREGGTIAIAPEGNRTYSGRTGHMSESIVPLARKLGLPVVLYRIEGGYGVQPRWSDKVRKGKIRSYVYRVIDPEEYGKMTDGEFFGQIKEGLNVDENADTGVYGSNKRAEYIERALYVCPYCGLSEFESKGNTFTCKKCGKTVEYGPDKKLSGAGFDLPFTYFGEWYDYQNRFVKELDTSGFINKPVYEDRARVSEVCLYKRKKTVIRSAQMRLYADRVTLTGETELTFGFDEVSAMAVLGRNKLNVYVGKTAYQIKGGKRFNALKYMNFYYLYKNKENGNGEFLGL